MKMIKQANKYMFICIDKFIDKYTNIKIETNSYLYP